MVTTLTLVYMATGITIATEAVVIAAACSLCPMVLVCRSMTWIGFHRVLAHVVKITDVALLLIAVSSILRFQTVYLEIPDATERILTQISTAPWLTPLYINIL